MVFLIEFAPLGVNSLDSLALFCWECEALKNSEETLATISCHFHHHELTVVSMLPPFINITKEFM